MYDIVYNEIPGAYILHGVSAPQAISASHSPSVTVLKHYAESSFVHTTLRFTPEEKAKRHPCAYMPFGYGPRNCIGMRFALLEVKMALIEIISKFRIVLAPETKVRLVTHANQVVTCRASCGNTTFYNTYVCMPQ